jgi:rsbT co-antagonist protein RsbR
MPTADPQITIDGVQFAWDRERDLFLISGMPAVGLLIESTLAHLLAGVERMVGSERFALTMQASGRQSVEGEWEAFIVPAPNVRAGLETLGSLTPLGGLGRWTVLEFDEAARVARFRVTAGWEAIYQQALGVTWGSSFAAGKFAGYCTRAFGTYCWSEQTAAVVRGDAYDEFVVRPSDLRLEARLEQLVVAGKATSEDLAAALAAVQREADERARAEAALREQLAVSERQAADILAMSSPILQVGDGVLAMPVIGRVDGERASRMMETLLAEIARTRARWTILDLTGVDAVDTPALHHMTGLVRAISLLGARCLLSGITPDVAQGIVELGSDLGALRCFATLAAALRFAATGA